jgi:hypothetical protein
MRDFIKDNREELKRLIRDYLKQPDFPLNTADLEQWIANDEGLYNWARSEGVSV